MSSEKKKAEEEFLKSTTIENGEVHVDVLRFYWAHKMCSKEVGSNERRLVTAGNKFC